MIQQLSLELCFATSFPENTFADIMVDVQERRDAGIFSQRQDILNFSSGLRSAVINDVLDRGMTVRSRSPWLAIAGLDDNVDAHVDNKESHLQVVFLYSSPRRRRMKPSSLLNGQNGLQRGLVNFASAPHCRATESLVPAVLSTSHGHERRSTLHHHRARLKCHKSYITLWL